ncbi:MAG: hypothetical protein L0216_20595 [Planctomycetales bacterium]|nr:hypothetical protein [Planctomycetales bacterium]
MEEPFLIPEQEGPDSDGAAPRYSGPGVAGGVLWMSVGTVLAFAIPNLAKILAHVAGRGWASVPAPARVLYQLAPPVLLAACMVLAVLSILAVNEAPRPLRTVFEVAVIVLPILAFGAIALFAVPQPPLLGLAR